VEWHRNDAVSHVHIETSDVREIGGKASTHRATIRRAAACDGAAQALKASADCPMLREPGRSSA
jgi:hypothetical protein